ncbi:OmpA family protein [Cytophaga hutchinsonii]|uniref:Outer membrane protein n=1 Tax=Cytophaga hutchinsonii (strain ATCC 33406 / DSM 1761 / CIP 103989 / NBRC 15051 / NCIMB 9469 / D465) TaxID=269798 RepID=A0A6N4SSM3_CYTH3|nr:OmpA family protein [Cytophaga hutchinsonii]ABG59404.1 outer membrane protein [Cytophaga hutchinsonii ATCC 33406]SFX93106.1 WD40-like Beta Propeller Repeat [Cytophaga hutchinsonii ATCC 33406]
MKKSIFLCLFFTSKLLFAQDASEMYVHQNLGENINSKATELTPRISADGKIMFFVRDGHPDNKNQQDIWHSEKDSVGNWAPAKRADDKINQLPANCVWSVNADGNSLLIRGAYDNGKYLGKGFSLTRLTKNGWTDPQMLVIQDLAKVNLGENDGAYLSTDGNAIIFTMCDKKKCTLYDLFVSTKKQDGTYTRPVKLGTTVNASDFNEFAPFLAADNKTLYFSSDRPGGLGLTDVYKTERLSDTSWLNWSTPVNMGEHVNTSSKDAYYVTDAKGEYAYMVSDLNSYGSADIIRFKLKEEHKPKPVALYDGKIYNAKTKEQILDATIEYKIYPDDSDEGVGHTDHETGQYKIILPFGHNYSVDVFAAGYVPEYDTITVGSKNEYIEITRDYYLVPIEVGQSIKLNHIYFETSKYDLLPESYYELDKVVKLLRENPKMKIEIEGHTDNQGNADKNMILSQNRAKSVMDYIISKGITADRITSKGFGITKPMVDNDTPENRQLNRRVEFTILQK